MELLLALLTGLGLSAACGFRVFVPLLVMGIAARAGQLQFAAGFAWISSDWVLLALAVATALEIAAYYVPWVDNLLDSIATPAAIIAGMVIGASAVSDISPPLVWALTAIAGGAVAGSVQILTVGVRAASTMTTGGLGNPVVSTGEWLASSVLALLALAPLILAAVVALLALAWATRRLARRRRMPQPA